MAKSRKTTKKSTRQDDAEAQAERLSKSLSESAQQIWLAGVGAFSRAQAEGSRLFEGLVREGVTLESTARKFAGKRADEVRETVEARVEQARGRATGTWDRLEKVFEERVQRALVKLGVPGRDDLRDLSARVDTLSAELRRRNGRPSAAKAPAKQAPRQPGKTAKVVGKAAKVASKTAAKKNVARKTAAGPAGSRTPRKAARKQSAS